MINDTYKKQNLDWKIKCLHFSRTSDKKRIPESRSDLVVINKKKKQSSHVVDFAVPANDRVKIKVKKKRTNSKILLET